MTTEKEIVEDYEKADFHDRVLLFLMHRDLRDQFIEFELHAYQNGGKEGQVVTARDKHKSSLGNYYQKEVRNETNFFSY